MEIRRTFAKWDNKTNIYAYDCSYILLLIYMCLCVSDSTQALKLYDFELIARYIVEDCGGMVAGLYCILQKPRNYNVLFTQARGRYSEKDPRTHGSLCVVWLFRKSMGRSRPRDAMMMVFGKYYLGISLFALIQFTVENITYHLLSLIEWDTVLVLFVAPSRNGPTPRNSEYFTPEPERSGCISLQTYFPLVVLCFIYIFFLCCFNKYI